MSHREFVFQDKGGKRWPRLKGGLLLLTALAFAGLVFFVQSLLTPMYLASPDSLQNLKKQLHALQKAGAAQQNAASDAALMKRLASKYPPPKKAKLAPGEAVRAAFFTGWDQNSVNSLHRHASYLTHVCPEWLRLTSLDGKIKEDPDANIDELAAYHPLIVMPTLTNLEGSDWVPEAVESLAFAPQAERDAFVADLITRLKQAKAGGVVIDWELMDPSYRPQLTELVRQIAKGLKAENLRTWLCVPMGDDFDTLDLESLAPDIARFVALLHDENSESDTPGPIASQDWFDGWLKVLMGYASSDKWIVSIANYGYDWEEGKPAAQTITFADAMSRAGNSEVEDVKIAEPFYNPSYSYYANGSNHDVWFLDAVTFLNQLGAARDYEVGGFVLNRLGTEDPKVWRAISVAGENEKLADALPEIGKLESGEMITSVGSGEIVSVDNSQKSGLRNLKVESEKTSEGQRTLLTGLYKDFPIYPTLFRQGAGDDHTVALTFDDGPDPEWTPQILEILKQRGVKATFFLLGRQAEEYPDLVKRIVDEGHEIGNHSYTHANLAVASPVQTRLEINATQRLLGAITGRRTTLFRPPYNADSQPTDIAELIPIEIAQSLDCMTVLEGVDTEDWERPGADVILQRVKDRRDSGNIILLHDAGGNREQTVEALPQILDYLQERGDKVVSISELLHVSRNDVMPELSPEQRRSEWLASSLGFRVFRTIGNFFEAFLVVATVLVVIRTLIVLILAIKHSRDPRPAVPPDFHPPLSILVPAYNEGKVIEKTLRSLLDTIYPGEIEVLVIDDGSKDDTVAQVRAFTDSRVRLLTQPNSGKAYALQNGVDTARHEIVVFIDADTQFTPQTLSRLVEPFVDEKIGAVSGHARVGNLRRFLARCQDLEYICGFNLDRRAYAVWNCITVVPGAISALRKSAIVAAGGFSHDTLAEDTDLTLDIHRAGYRVDYQPEAIAYTEAPETIGTLAKQRFRWAYGTLQCVWKHGDIVFNRNYKALGWFSLPSIWFFQVVLVAFAPFIDILFIESLLLGEAGAILPYFAVFLLMDLLLALYAVHLEGMPLRTAFRIIPQRFIYRPLLSYVIWKAVIHALRGAWVGWGKLQRTASVSVEA